MADFDSLLIVFSTSRALVERAQAVLAPWGWACRGEADIAAALDVFASTPPAAILVDQRAESAEALVSAVRQLSVPLNGTPILTAVAEENKAAGQPKQIAAALPEEAFLGLLRQWAGPLDDHGLRRPPWNFRYRLIRLLGLDGADELLRRLRTDLRQAAADGGDAVSAHRLAGLAGLCGFAELSRLWSRVDRREAGALAEALAAAREAATEIDQVLGEG